MYSVFPASFRYYEDACHVDDHAREGALHGEAPRVACPGCLRTRRHPRRASCRRGDNHREQGSSHNFQGLRDSEDDREFEDR